MMRSFLKKRTDALIKLFNPDKLTVKTIKGTGHNTVTETTEFSSTLIDFFAVD